MGKTKRILLVGVIGIALSASVYGAASTSPVATTVTEKASRTIWGASINGVVYNLTPSEDWSLIVGTYQPALTLDKIHWCVDETFYLTGYKAKLNKTVTEISAPPDRQIAALQLPYTT